MIGLALVLEGKNPGVTGRFPLGVSEYAPLVATGTYDNGREENVTLALYYTLAPDTFAEVSCEQEAATRVLLTGKDPGILEVSAATRPSTSGIIPCSPTPDGGWIFPDAGQQWPLQSNTLIVEVR